MPSPQGITRTESVSGIPLRVVDFGSCVIPWGLGIGGSGGYQRAERNRSREYDLGHERLHIKLHVRLVYVCHPRVTTGWKSA